MAGFPLPAAPLLAALSRVALDLLGVLLRETSAERHCGGGADGAGATECVPIVAIARHRLIRLIREGREVRPEPIAGAVHVDLAAGT